MRNGLVDYCRLLAAIGIIWLHAGVPGGSFAWTAMPFFLIMLARPSHSGLAARADRLLRPYAIWWLIYAAYSSVQSVLAGYPPLSWFQPLSLVYGSAIHLWFLPFAFFMAVLTPLLRARPVALAAPIVAALVVGLLPRGIAPPGEQYAFGIVPVMIGVAWFTAGRAALIPAAISLAILAAFHFDRETGIVAAGTLGTLVCLSLWLPPTRLSAWCARVSMDVYLVHWLFLMLLRGNVTTDPVSLLLMVSALSLGYGAAMDLWRQRRPLRAVS